MLGRGTGGLDAAAGMAKGVEVLGPFLGHSLAELALLLLAAALVGFAKTAIGGVASISVAIFAAVLPARESTGSLLPLLILGDLFALSAYRSHVDVRTLLRLVPTVVVGIAAGAYFVSRVDDLVMRRTIGVVLLGLVGVNLWTRARRAVATVPAGAADAGTAAPVAPAVPAADGPSPLRRRAAAAVYGSLTGFTTMVANAGGPVMSLYMLATRMPMLAFLGTGAWLFAVFNLVKVPFMVGLGLLTPGSLVLDAALAPALFVGALVGRRVIRRIDQAMFERVVLVVTVLSSLNLVR